ncbi:Uncharacterized protein Adt_35056 [Abeliophyllum distichum]|uniref:Uncharacterized protein n=1 Tax=Abeliophyllum distichum TaxID=126358 RepID=A0ABD1QDM2_9LAMI
MDNRSKPRLDRTEKAALICSHYHKSGHDIATCFDIHGTPDWYLEKYGPTFERKGHLKGKPNTLSHKSSAGRGRTGVRANAAALDVTRTAPLTKSSPTPAAHSLTGFTAD